MPTFTFKACDSSGNVVVGELDGDSVALVKEAIYAKGLIPTQVNPKGLQAASFSFFQKKPSQKDIASMTRQFQVMFAVGTPIDKILALLARQLQNPALKKAMTRIHKDVAAGSRLSVAFGAYPQFFSPLYISMIEVGETGGILDKTLREMAAIMEKESEIHSKVKAAMLYPKIVMFVLAAVTWGMLAFVIPPFKAFYASHGAELPMPTKIVLAMSGLVTTYWYLGILGGFAIYFLWRSFTKTALGEDWISRLAFKIPVFGRLNRLTANARFGHLLSGLYRAGVPVAHALSVVAKTMSNIHYANDVLMIKRGIEQGSSLSKCMENTRYFEPMVQEAVSVGEKTGQLDVLLHEAANFYDVEIDGILKNLSTLIEPILLVFLFAGVTVLALAIYLPIWNMSKVMLPK